MANVKTHCLSIQGRYASGLLKACDQDLREDFEIIYHSFRESKPLSSMLQGGILKSKDAFRLIDDVYTSLKLNPALLNLLKVLYQNKRIYLLKRIAKEYKRTFEERNDITAVQITSAYALKKAQRDILEKSIAQYFQKTNSINFSYKVRPHIIGGFQLYSNGYLHDLSLQTEIDHITTIIKEAQNAA